MKLLLVFAVLIIGVSLVYAEKGTFVDEIQFIQYLDENTALEEVKNGNLDLYYYRITSDRIENLKSREGLKIYESTGGSYSILVNPAESEKFNPFSINDVRFALNYLVDRKLIVNELMGGFGNVMISNYGPFDPDYIFILDELESFHFRYNPILADQIISQALEKVGAKKSDGKWTFEEKEIELTIFIRSDDPVRKSIGEILSSELEKLGFKVTKDFGDLNKAFAIVYGSNPADLKWSIYTEGWGGRSAFVKYDSVGLGQMYSPWFSNMPGYNDPSYWNYKNDYLDSITQQIYTGNFSSAEDRTALIKNATSEGIKESVRIFLASKIDQYVVNEDVVGVVNDLGAGVPSRFTPINSRSDSDSLKIGVKQIYQGAWNPVGGISDVYSRHIWDTLYDPGIFMNPYTGDTFPIRTNWEVESLGSDEKLEVPSEAIIWNSNLQEWENVNPGIKATSKVTFDMMFSNWHHGQLMDMNDILYSIYFTLEWGSEGDENDKTFDAEFSPRQAQTAQTIIAINPLDNDSIEVYVDYWHFDESEIASWANVWSATPWEIMYALEQAVLDGKLSFSRSGAVSKSVNWASLIVPNDAQIVYGYLDKFKNSKSTPISLMGMTNSYDDLEIRYDSSIDWINEKKHAIISNGPFVLERYSPESRTITITSFDDPTYPFEAGHWKEFEQVEFPKILDLDFPQVINRETDFTISIKTKDASQVQYFISNSEGNTVASGIQIIVNDQVNISISKEVINKLSVGANDFKVFVVSDSVLRPNFFSTSFIVADNLQKDLPEVEISLVQKSHDEIETFGIAAVLVGIIFVLVISYMKKKSSQHSKKI